MFSLKLFGGASLEGPDGILVGRAAQRHRIALLALLSSAPTGGISRDKVVALLWPEADQERARHLLANSVYLLRQALGKEAIIGSEDVLWLDSDHLCVDVREFEDALRRGELEKAVYTYRGPFLDGFFLAGSQELGSWIERERERLAGLYAHALEKLAQAKEADEDFAAAAMWWGRLAAHTPHSSPVALRLMQALAAAGDTAGAIRHAQVHQARLRDDLGINPSPDVISFAESLRARSAPDTERSTPSLVEMSEPDRGSAQPGAFGLDAAEGADGSSIPLNTLALPSTAELGETAHGGVPAKPPVATKAYPSDVRHPPFGRLRNNLMTASGAAVALALILLSVRVIGKDADSLPKGIEVRPAQDQIVVAEFSGQSGDSLLAGVVTDALRIDLRQSRNVQVVEPVRVRQALARMQKPDAHLTADVAQEVAVREGADAVIAGTIGKVGTGYVLSARLIAAESGRELISLRETAANPDALIPAIDRLSKRLRRGIGEPLQSIRASPPLAQVTTPSLEALKRFSQAGRAAYTQGDFDRAILLYEQAVALDTAFAEGYIGLFQVLGNRSTLGLREERMRMLRALRKAYQHRTRVTELERYGIEALYQDKAMGEPERAAMVWEAMAEAHPTSPRPWAALSYYYPLVRNHAGAENAARRALAIDPSSPTTLLNLASAQSHLGKFAEAEQTLGRFARKYPGMQLVHANTAGWMASARGDHARAEQLLLKQRAAHPNDLASGEATARRLAVLAALRGQLDASERYLREVSRVEEKSKLPGSDLRLALALARQDLLLRRSPHSALRRMDEALARTVWDSIPLLDRPYLETAWIYAHAGRVGRARELAAAFEAEVPSELRHVQNSVRQPLLHPYAAGTIALAEGRTTEAVELLRRADEGTCIPCALPMLGLAYERGGESDSAVAVYERYLHPVMRHWPDVDADWLALVYRRLGVLYERRGERAKAAAVQARLSSLWREADPVLRVQ